MKLLIVSDYFYPHWTGIVKSFFNLLTSTNIALKYQILVLTVKYDKNLTTSETINNIKILRVPYLIKFSRVYYSLLIILKFIKMLPKYDTVIINSPCSNIAPLSLIAKLVNKKLIIFHQGDLILPKGKINKIIEKIFDISCFISFTLADKVSCYSKDYAENSRVLKPFLRKFSPLIMPIKINKSITKTGNISLQKLVQFKKENKIIFGFGGRFVEEKGFDILLKAIPDVIKSHPATIFAFAGQTNVNYEKHYQENSPLINQLKNHLMFVGLLTNNDLDYFYKNIDFIIIPSRTDCFNIVQAEAMLHGKKSIVSDIPGARYLVKKTGFGYLFTSLSPKSLALTIKKAINDKKGYQQQYLELNKLLAEEKIINDFNSLIN